MLRLITLLTGILAFAPAPAAARDAEKYFFQPTFGNFQEELDLARKSDRQGVLLFFEMNNCPYCRRMKTEVLNQPQVQDFYRRRFRIFSVNIEGSLPLTDFQGRQTTEKALASDQYRVRATPVFAFFDLDGKMIARYTGATNGAEEFLWLGEYVAEGKYRSETFARFKHTKRLQARAE